MKLKLNTKHTLCVIKSGLNSLWRVLELLLTISLNYELRYFNSSFGWIIMSKQYQACICMSNNNNARCKELRVERKIQTQTRRNVSRFELPLYIPAFTQKDFNYPLLDLPQRDLHWGITTYNLGVHNSNSHTSIQERARSKEKIELSDLMITNSLGNLERSQIIFSQYKYPKANLRW